MMMMMMILMMMMTTVVIQMIVIAPTCRLARHLLSSANFHHCDALTRRRTPTRAMRPGRGDSSPPWPTQRRASVASKDCRPRERVRRSPSSTSRLALLMIRRLCKSWMCTLYL